MMLFEKTIRKKRISPFFLELISFLIIEWTLLVFLISLIIVFFYFYCANERDFIPFLFFILAMMMVYIPLFLLSCNFNAVKQGIYSRRKNSVVFSTKDHMIIDYWVEPLLGPTGYSISSIYSDLFLFFKEPYIYKIGFLTLPENQNVVRAKEFKFYSSPSGKFRFHKDYRRYKDEFMASGSKDMRYRLSYSPGNLRDAKKYGGKDYQVYYMYMTYEKAQVFNRLFELVKPPKFRIVYNEKGNILMKLQPIPGKEYPPEALECMEKINAMYP